MRIGINGRFLAAPVTGVQRFAGEVVSRLLVSSEEVVLYLPRGVRPPADWPDPAHLVSGTMAGHAWEQLELPQRLHERCDVCLHLSGTAPVRGGPHVMILHDVLPLTEPTWFSPLFAAWYRFAAGRAARNAAAVVTVSEWSRARIADRLDIPPGRIRVAPQGVAPFDRPASPDAVRTTLEGLGIDRPYVLTLGAGDRRKNASFLADVMRRWRTSDDDVPAFVLVGDASPRVHGAAQRPEPGLIALGRVSDEALHALYTGAAAFAFPSLAEGFGRPPLEALACGTPAVVADYGCAREVLDGEATIVALDADAWVGALRAACREPSGQGTERARRVAARWRWEPAVEVVLDACRAATGAPLERTA